MSEKSERSLTDLQHAVWVLVEEQKETNRLLRIVCAANSAAAEAAQVPKTKGE